MADNGWRTGRDPVQRWLRVLTVVVCLGVFIYLSADRDNLGNALPTAGLALGAVLILLGYEGLVRLPGIGRDKDEK